MSKEADSIEAEAFERALSKCRTCKHIRMAHSFLKSAKGNCIDVSITAKGLYLECTCHEFVPDGNLEFLQWKYEQKKVKGKKK